MNFLRKNGSAEVISLRRWLRLNLLLLGLVLLLSMSFPVSTLSQKMSDLYFHLRPAMPTSSQVAVVLIDDATLDHYGRWPWPRQRLAQLIRAVSNQHPNVIGLDVLLPEPEDERNDAELAAAIGQAPKMVLAAKLSGSPNNHLWTDPLLRFAQNAKGVGHVQAIIDDDGVCRSVPVEEPTTEGPRPAFALKLAELVNPSLAVLETQFASRGSGVERLGLRPLIIDFRRQVETGGETQPFITLSAGDLLAGKLFPQLDGKAVVIGFGAVEMSDRLATPVSGQSPMPGVEINANVLDMLLAGRVLTRLGMITQFLMLVTMGALSLWLVVRFPGVRGLVMLLALLIGGYLAAYLEFLYLHRLLYYGPLLLAGILAAPIAQLENLLLVNREITARLQQLRRAINPAAGKTSAGPKVADTSAHLHWKLAALNELQAELSSLYSFQHTLFETMREGLAVYGEDGWLRFGNFTWQKFCERQAAAPDSLSGLSQLNSAWPELAAVAQAGGAWVETELPLGEELWHLYAVPLPWTSFAQDGAVMLIAEDITARRQRDQARSEALSFVTHELRTPLIAIQGFSELLMRYPNSPASGEAPATIFRETNRLVAMINTYLEVLRLDSGARPLRMTKASIRGMAVHVEKVVRPLAAAAKIQVNVKIDCADGEDELVLCDETLISGALLNLVSNAIKYGIAGSEVTVSVSARENEFAFQVHNAGPAIPASDLKQIFERFYRPSRSESIPGWGLGLSFVRRICQQHGGRVEVSSNEISGTSFLFTLPRGVREVTEVAP